MARVGLMGFGRIGRNVFRLLDAAGDVEIAAIADTAEPAALAYLLKYDSIYGRFPKPVELDGTDLIVDGAPIPFVSGPEPGDVDWGELGVDIVIQATGKYRTKEWCTRHITSGAKRVILAYCHLHHLVGVRVIHKGSMLSERELVGVSFSRLDMGLAETSDPVHTTG